MLRRLHINTPKAGLTLKDLHDIICMIVNRFSDFYCVYTFMQVVHTKVVRTEYSDLKSFSKMSQE